MRVVADFGDSEKIVEILLQKPKHWLDWYEGRFRNNEGGPSSFIPCQLTDDQVREVNSYADGAIVGTAFIKAYQQGGLEALVAKTKELAGGLG